MLWGETLRRARSRLLLGAPALVDELPRLAARAARMARNDERSPEEPNMCARSQFLLDAPALVDELARLAARAARTAPLLRLLVSGALLALRTEPHPGAPDVACEPEAAGVHTDPNPRIPNPKMAPAAAALLTALVARVPPEEGEAAAVADGVLRAAAAAGSSDAAALQPVLRCAAAQRRVLGHLPGLPSD